MTKHLGFGALVRVSSEQQKNKGKSLEIQSKQIKFAVRQLKGKVNRWYIGSEQATVNEERELFEQLLIDATENKFGAVIVTNPDRWARDNLKSKQALKILKDNGIGFFILTHEYDLFDPLANFMLGVAGEAAEFQGMLQLQKSMISRIEKTRQGIPAVPDHILPYGRIFDRRTNQWKIDKGKKEAVQEAIEKYLSGTEPVYQIAQDMPPPNVSKCKAWGMSTVSLLNLFRNHLGSKWMLKFRSKRLGINEVFELKIPPLAEPHVIRKVKERMRYNCKRKGGYNCKQKGVEVYKYKGKFYPLNKVKMVKDNV